MSAWLSYDVHGPVDAPAVVLGSSLGTTRAMWDNVLPYLTEHFRVVTYDHLGHGQSFVPAGPYSISELARHVVAVLDELGIARAHVGGVSLGGMAALRMAVDYPDRVGHLGLVCTSAHLPPASMWRDRAATVRSQGMPAIADAVTRRWFTPGFAGADRAAELRDQFRTVPAEGYAACCEAIAAMDLRPILPQVAAPTVVIAGQDDPATPVDHATTITEGISTGGARAHTVVVPGAHLAAVEHPHAVAAALVEHWLAS